MIGAGGMAIVKEELVVRARCSHWIELRTRRQVLWLRGGGLYGVLRSG